MTAPAEPEYLPVNVYEPTRTPWALVEAETGPVLPGRLPSRGWHLVGAGTFLVGSDHDDPHFRVFLKRVDAEKATAPEESIVYSGRRADGECELALAPWGSDEFIGSGSRIAAVTSDGRPQLFDLATGDAVWIGSAAGVSIDGDDQAVLVREQADRGALSLLDMSTGTTRWTIPDPGLETTSASWRTIVTHSRVALQGWDDEGPRHSGVRQHEHPTGSWDPWRVMEAARYELARMRGSAGVWRELRYERATGADGYDCDRNAVRRATVLWALQYDRGPDDLPLIRWVAEQEARCRREAPFQGLSEETDLAGLLLAEYRRVEDVWLHWEIKRANFDTWCGYDREYLCAAGVRATIAYVRDSGHADRGPVLELLLDGEGRPCVSEDGLAKWWQRQRSRFPADPGAEDPLTWVGRAKLAGDRELARRELDRWLAGRERDSATLGQLRHQLADLGAHAEAARVQRESLVYAETPWDSASSWLALAGLERRADNHHAAWDALRECRRALDGVSGWAEVGLGRMYVEELFLLVGSAEGELGEEVFAEADRQARDVPGLPLAALRSAVAAADKVGDQSRVEHYQNLHDAEQRRIDAELALTRDASSPSEPGQRT
ncbi:MULTISPECIES: hypothetical protein [unclassified Nocardia]|uniref:hypothetical protein n=1 Tax=unclassified Nocardia TaxID=2637762 RepID=UPI0024A9F0C9|nr:MULTISPECIES: hypothetical protein [unclassified Nocardia]